MEAIRPRRGTKKAVTGTQFSPVKGEIFFEDPSCGYIDIESNYEYNGDRVAITTTTDIDYNEHSLFEKRTTNTTDVIINTTTTTIPTNSRYAVVTVPEYYWNNNSVVISAPIEKEKVIKNISVLKCKCCDAKLDAKKMKNNIIKCEYCDSDNYINME